MEIERDKPMWGLGELLQLAWPAGLSMLNGTIMMFVDGMMVASLGPQALGAQFVAGIMTFVPTSLGMGILTVVNTFVSQNFGAGRRRQCGQYVWAGLTLAVIFAAIVQLLHIPAGSILSLFGHAPAVQRLEGIYFHYMLAGTGLFLICRVLEQFFFGIGRSGVVLFSSTVGNAFNVVANYALIFGKWGLPAMGIKGAAIGTLAGTGLMIAILLSVFLGRKINERFASRRALGMKLAECLEILRTGTPAGIQFCNDILSWSIVTGVLVGFFGTEHLAANTVAVRYISLSFMPAVGISIATTALVGRYIGMGRLDLARRRAHVAAITAMVYMGLCGAAMWVWRQELVGFYLSFGPDSQAMSDQVTAEIIRIGSRLLLCAAVFQVFDAIAIIFIGALRGAGDTFWPMVMTMSLSWVFQIGVGAAMVKFLPQLESLGVWIAAGTYIACLSVVLAWRFESGAWKKIKLIKHKAPPAMLDTPLEK